MPEQATLERARRDKREGKASTTQAGEFVREEMHHARSGKHPVKSRKQAIAIGLNEARREGADGPPRKKSAKKSARKRSAKRSSASSRRASR